MLEVTVAEAIARAVRALSGRTDSPRLDAEVLLAYAIGCRRVYLYQYPERAMGAAAGECFESLVGRRARGEPIAYLVGRREFWSLDLEVSCATLIPRAETESLVSAALGRIPPGAAWRAADLGTGSGGVAIAIALERPEVAVTATDRSAEALAVAGRNVARLAPGRVRLARGDWCAALEAPAYHVLVANPPYVCEDDPVLAGGELAFEPRLALSGGPDGLGAIRVIAAGAPARLRRGGWLLLEHGSEQGAQVRGLLRRLGYEDVRTERDLAGRERVTEGRRP